MPPVTSCTSIIYALRSPTIVLHPNIILEFAPSMDPMVKPGVYTLQCDASSRYMDTRREDLGDGLYQNRLLLRETASNIAKWEVIRVGDGYMIKLADSELYCAAANAGEFEGKAVVLSTVPSIWTFAYLDAELGTVVIFSSASLSNVVWQENPYDEDRAVRISRMDTEKSPMSATWRLNAVESSKLGSTGFVPGIYALQNKASKTYVSLGPNEKTIGCWPESDLKRGIPKWEISPLGDGYTIKLYGSKKYCTVLNSTSNGSAIVMSTYPSTWRVEMATSSVHEEGHYCQISWGETDMVWHLEDRGSAKPGTSVNVYRNTAYQANRVFMLVP